jgi:hypothetical protein
MPLSGLFVRSLSVSQTTRAGFATHITLSIIIVGVPQVANVEMRGNGLDARSFRYNCAVADIRRACCRGGMETRDNREDTAMSTDKHWEKWCKSSPY